MNDHIAKLPKTPNRPALLRPPRLFLCRSVGLQLTVPATTCAAVTRCLGSISLRAAAGACRGVDRRKQQRPWAKSAGCRSPSAMSSVAHMDSNIGLIVAIGLLALLSRLIVVAVLAQGRTRPDLLARRRGRNEGHPAASQRRSSVACRARSAPSTSVTASRRCAICLALVLPAGDGGRVARGSRADGRDHGRVAFLDT